MLELGFEADEAGVDADAPLLHGCTLHSLAATAASPPDTVVVAGAPVVDDDDADADAGGVGVGIGAAIGAAAVEGGTAEWRSPPPKNPENMTAAVLYRSLYVYVGWAGRQAERGKRGNGEK